MKASNTRFGLGGDPRGGEVREEVICIVFFHSKRKPKGKEENMASRTLVRNPDLPCSQELGYDLAPKKWGGGKIK